MHGNSKKKETSPDGSADVNVFDIQQGVSINLFVKTGRKNSTELGKVFHYDLYGKREAKYEFLSNNSIGTIEYKELENVEPNYFFVLKDFLEQKVFNEGFLISELFSTNNVGIVSANDSILINNNPQVLLNVIKDHYDIDTDKLLINKISYRPFDEKYIYYDIGLIERSREKIMQHFIKNQNVGLNWIRPMSSKYEFSIFISKNITDQCSAGNKSAGAGISYIAPLYLYNESKTQLSFEQSSRIPNLNAEIVKQITKRLSLTFTNEKETTENTFAPIDLLDYIYAVLHSPAYREKYKEFLKIDFPRVPYPTDAQEFWRLVQLGGELRQLHLLESPKVQQYITQYPEDGTNVVGKIRFESLPEGHPEPVEGLATGKVWINEAQYFAGVPQTAWNFYIGGYQPAQKWLKDRKDRELSFEDILHYQQMIVALTETARVMGEIDGVQVD